MVNKMNCPACGAAVEKPSWTNSFYCPKCFDRIEVTTTKPETDSELEAAELLFGDEPRAQRVTNPQVASTNRIPCPFCGEAILAVARKCKHCGEILDPQLVSRRKAEDTGSAHDEPKRVQYVVSPPVRRQFPHLIHIVLCFITFGGWLPIYLIHYVITRGPGFPK